MLFKRQLVMKFQSNVAAGLLIFLAFVTVQCSSGRYFSDFKSQKRSIDSLTVFQPVVYITSMKGKEQVEDIAVRDSVRVQISRTTQETLSDKYGLAYATLTDSVASGDIAFFFSMLDNSGDMVAVVNTPEFMQHAIMKAPGRYCLMLFFQGSFVNELDPNYTVTHMMRSNTIIINPIATSRSDIRLVVFDKARNQVAYYNRVEAKNSDPRLLGAIDQMTLTVLRSIYYK